MYTKESIFPLYVGKCKVGLINATTVYELKGIHREQVYLQYGGFDYAYPISDCTLLLKPLSKMSEEDCKDFAINVANATEREWESNKGARESTIEELRDLASSRLGTLTESVPVVLWLINHGYAISDELFELNIAEEI